mmetsp:Transcript_10385/g.35839  ORF Transcript_10385/g.35839 Transcript_10385/m.35839 type:complete len:219 (-) Transcript_10385:2352-3008(-)
MEAPTRESKFSPSMSEMYELLTMDSLPPMSSRPSKPLKDRSPVRDNNNDPPICVKFPSPVRFLSFLFPSKTRDPPTLRKDVNPLMLFRPLFICTITESVTFKSFSAPAKLLRVGQFITIKSPLILVTLSSAERSSILVPLPVALQEATTMLLPTSPVTVFLYLATKLVRSSSVEMGSTKAYFKDVPPHCGIVQFMDPARSTELIPAVAVFTKLSCTLL